MAAKHIPYFSLYPADFMNGVRGMSAQEVGVYMMLLCRIYEENGPVEYNALRLSTYCGMRQNTFDKTFEKLVALGKISLIDGMLSNHRADAEISKRANDLKNSSKAGKASAEKRQQKQQKNPTDVNRSFNHTDTDTDTDKAASQQCATASPHQQNLDQTNRERLLAAMGADPVSGLIGPNGTLLGGVRDTAIAEGWAALGLSLDRQCAVIAEVASRSKAKGQNFAPRSFGYFTGAMEDAARGQSSAQASVATADPLDSMYRKYGVA